MDKLFIELLNLSIAASWMILAVLILRLVLKRAPKSLICALWLLVGLRLLLPVSVESALSLIPSRRTVSAAIAEPGTLPPVSVGGQTSPGEDGGAALPSQVEVIDSGLPALDRALNPVINESLAPAQGDSVDPLQVLTALSGWVWLLGCLVMLGYGAFSFLRLKLRLRESVLAGPGVREGAMVDSPFVLGVFRPVIYLPLGLSERDREMVLAHEKAHLKRRDNWVKPLTFILLALHWFNPLMWLAYVLLCRDMEAACDQRVLKDMGREERRAYSAALLNCSVRHRAIGACPLAFGELSVKGRIKSVLNYRKPGFWISLAALAACALVALCFLTDPVTEDENPQAGPESLAAEGESEAEGGLPEEDAQLLFVIPEEGEGADYAPPELGQIQMGYGQPGTWYVDLRMMSDLNSMLAACRSAGHQVEVGMAYTSYDDLQTMYGDMEMSDGTKSARSPISRERQTGLAVLLERRAAGDYDPAADSRQAQEEQAAWQETLSWLEENCAGFGFIQRFPPDKEQITGINGLENLFRYVGHGAAEYLGSRDLCLEEYLLIAADASIDSGYSLPQVEILGAYAQGEDYCCYVKLSELDPGYLSMDSGKLYINGLYTRPDGQPLVLLSNAGYGSELLAAVYDDRTESLTLCLFARDWKNSLGEGWPKEIELKMTVNGQIIPSLGMYRLPEPSAESLSFRLDRPVEYDSPILDNPVRLLGAELYPCGAAWVLDWADYERYLEDNSNFNSLSQEEENWLAEQSMGYTSAQWQFRDSGLIYFADGSSLAFPAMSVSYGRDGEVLLNTEIFPQPIDLDSVTAVSLAGQMIEVK